MHVQGLVLLALGTVSLVKVLCVAHGGFSVVVLTFLKCLVFLGEGTVSTLDIFHILSAIVTPVHCSLFVRDRCSQVCCGSEASYSSWSS